MDSNTPSTAALISQAQAMSPKIGDNPTFMQDNIAIQRNPSSAKRQVNDLTRNLSLRSNGSRDIGTSQTGIANVLHEDHAAIDEDPSHRDRSDSDGSTIEAIKKCSLSKSSSEKSTKSNRSVRSVRSVHAVGSHPIGTLRVHEASLVHAPDPTQTTNSIFPDDRLKSGDVIIVRDVPGGSIIGYDTIAFTLKEGEPFNGIRDIPAGIHFIWGGSKMTSLRNGCWVIVPKLASDEYGSIHVRRWDKESDVLEEEISKAEVRIQKEELPEFFDTLHSFMTSSMANSTTSGAPKTQLSALKITSAAQDPDFWSRMTSCIQATHLIKLTGKREWNQWQVSSVHDFKNKHTLTREPNLPRDYSKDEVINFTFPTHKRTYSEESIGRLRTLEALDATNYIYKIIVEQCDHQDADELVSEIQFCYVTGMLLGNAACMEQWANIVMTMFTAYDLVLHLPNFVRKFIDAVHAQFIYDDEAIDGSILDYEPGLAQNLKRIMTTFKARLNDMFLELGNKLTKEHRAVGDAFKKLEEFLWKWDWELRSDYIRGGCQQNDDGQFEDDEFGDMPVDWQAEAEQGEFAPVVVELDENGREKGLVSF